MPYLTFPGLPEKPLLADGTLLPGDQSKVQARSSEKIKKLQAERSKRTQITADAVLRMQEDLAKSAIGDIVDFTSPDEFRMRRPNEIPAHAQYALQSIRVRRTREGQGPSARTVEVTEFKLRNGNKAVNKLGEHLGLWNKKPDQGGPNLNVNLTVEDLAKINAKIAAVEAEIDGVELPALPAPREPNDRGGDQA